MRYNFRFLGYQHPALVVMSLFLWLSPLQTQGQISPLGDSYTDTTRSTANFGASALLQVNGASQITYIQFPLSSIPTNASVRRATLKLFVNSVAKTGSLNVDFVHGSWTESTIDASNSPTVGAPIASNVDVASADENQYILVDVTSAVESWLDETVTNNGIALVANGSFEATFDSKENTGTSHPPELDLVFAGGNGTITGVTTASGGGLTGGGTSGTLKLSLSHACAKNEILKWSGSSWACSSVGTGTITGVMVGNGLTGGGTSGSVSLDLDLNVLNGIYPQLGANNVFEGSQVVNGTFAVNSGASQSPKPAIVAATGIDGHTLSLYPSLGAQDFNNIVQAGDEALIYTNGALGTGALVIAPWAGATSGIRMNGEGQVLIGQSTPPSGGFQLDVQEDKGLDPFIARGVKSSNFCYVDNTGNLSCSGSKNAVVPVDDGKRWVAMSAIESPVNWFEDAGSARLVNGVAVVELDPTFIQTVNSASDYKVFPVPNGDCKGLYVTNKTATSFEVREIGGGRSSVDFDYRIMAVRKNYETIRFADRTHDVDSAMGSHKGKTSDGKKQ